MDKSITDYLGVVDDGEVARLAAMMTPKSEVFDARSLVAQASALQAEANAELIRRREAIVSTMSYATLKELAGHLGFEDITILRFTDEESFPQDPIITPVLRRLASIMREMPPIQDFPDFFLADDPTSALELAASRTTLRFNPLNASFEDALRYAANISPEEISWDILNGAFLDFLRMWFRFPRLPAELFPDCTEARLTKVQFSEVLAHLKSHHEELAIFHDSFTPGLECPPDIDELVHRAYAECWENGLLGLVWRRRLAWLVVEFTPFWHRHAAAYLAIHQVRVKSAATDELKRKRAQQKESDQKRKAGEVGRQSREGERWRLVTDAFIESLPKTISSDSDPASLQECVATFVRSSSSLGAKQKRASTLEFLQVLCVAALADKDAVSAFQTLKRSKLTKIAALEPEVRKQRKIQVPPNQMEQYRSKGTTPSNLIQYKSLTLESVSVCLEVLKNALSKASVKK